MGEYIECRNCDSPYCEGCNIHTLATMLNNGKFDCLMDDNHSINPAADVVEVVHAAWELVRMDENDMSIYRCTNCKTKRYGKTFYCSRCGAKMD